MYKLKCMINTNRHLRNENHIILQIKQYFYAKLVQNEAIAAGVIVGLAGQQPENNDPSLENTEFAAEIPELPSEFEPDFIDDIKGCYSSILWNFYVLKMHLKYNELKTLISIEVFMQYSIIGPLFHSRILVQLN